MKPLNPIMAVLVIASVGAAPLRTLAGDGAAAPAATAEDKNPLNALSKILAENPSARTDAGKRMEEFLLDPDGGGKSFVKDGVDRKALGAVAREWGEQSPAGTVAVLYFVVGPGLSSPGWALKDPVLAKTFASGMKWEGRLRAALSDWTGKSQIDKTKEKTQAAAFLTSAAAKAADVFADQRTKKEIDDSILANNTTAPAVPDTTRGTGSRLDGALRQYTLDDLYGPPAAVVTHVSGPNDPNSRKISMKIYTKRMPDGTTRNEIGIFDITDTNDIFGQRFPIDSGKQSFALDDRTEGHKKYELTFGDADAKGNRTIKFARPGDGGVPLNTDMSALFIARADQAAGMGNIVSIGGQDFYTLPQGGAKSALALFPKALIDARGSGDARNLVPSLFAEVGVRGSDGRNENVAPGPKGGPHLGTVDGKDFHLEFNKTLGAWEVKPGGGDLPAAPASPTAPTTGDGTAPGGNPGGTPTGGDGMSIADLEALLLRSPECKKNADDIKDLAAGLKGKYGIISCNTEVDGLQQIILVPKTASTPSQQLRYGNVSGFKLQRARFFDRYLVLVFDKQVQYLDLLKADKDADGKEGGFALSGFISEKNASKFADSNAFSDALRHYMGVAGADTAAITEVPKRVASTLPGKAYNLSGQVLPTGLVVVATSGGEQYGIWPKLVPPNGDTVPTPNPYTSLSGPANAMDGAVSSVNDAFRAEFTMDNRTAKLLGGTPEAAEAKGVALYELVDPIGKDTDKRYVLSFKYKALDPKDPSKPEGAKEPKVFRQKFFEVFNKSNPHPGDGLVLESLLGAAVVDDRVASGYKFVPGSTKEKGVLAVFQNKQVSAANAKKGSANCVGAVAWWGLSGKQALTACQEDKL
jgi:hypothetical protein